MKILNFGSLNIDKTYNIKNFVKPGETVMALKYREFCGGKGLNQSIALSRAGAEIYHAGIEDGNPEYILEKLSDRYPDAEIVLTLGEKGSCYQGTAGTFYQPAYRIKTVDTTAAGDTFCGYFIQTYSQGQKPEEALKRAAKASAIAVSRQGASPSIPLAEEVAAYLNK